jgi:hypothetical protein
VSDDGSEVSLVMEVTLESALQASSVVTASSEVRNLRVRAERVRDSRDETVWEGCDATAPPGVAGYVMKWIS